MIRVLVNVTAALLAGLISQTSAPPAATAQAHWPSFRGPNASGVTSGPDAPVEFGAPSSRSVTASRNVKWKTPIPGLGHGSPIIWGDRVFLTTAVSGQSDPQLKVGLYGDIAPVNDDTEHEWRVLCLDAATGKVLWNALAHKGVPAVKRHTKATHANATPATDGKHVVAFFGSEGLYCFDFEGTQLWKKEFGLLDSGYYVVPQAQWGFGSSPIIHEGKVIVQCDVQGESFIAALDVKDGSEIWRTPRDEVPTWSTPTVVTHDNRTQIVVNGYKHIGGYDFATGKELWRMKGGGDIPVPTPIFGGGLIYLANAHGPAAPVWAVKPSAEGDITLAGDSTTSEHVAWRQDRVGVYMQTLLYHDGLVYACRDNGILTCFDAATGETVYKERLGSGNSGFTASPVASGGRIYFTSEEGDVYVLAAGDRPTGRRELTVLATNRVGEICMATPAIAEGVLYIRSKDHLFAFAETP
jgi:outer membrane protein assembly factor BamB